MTVKVSKPAINVREELADLRKPTGVAGEAMLRAETPQEQFNLIGAGRRNLIINGGFDVWQRASSQTANGYLSADRWQFQGSGGTITASKQSYVIEGSVVNGCNYGLTTADNSSRIEQRIEDVHTANGKDVTVSFWIKGNSARTLRLYLIQDFGTSGSSSVLLYKDFTANTEFTKHTFTFSLPSTEGKTVGSGSYVALALYNQANETYTQDIALVQAELGKVATPFEHRSYGEELALCQRYTYVIGGSGVTTLGGGSMYTSTAVNIDIPLPVQMRDTSPSLTPVPNGTGNWLNVYVGATGTVSNATPQVGDGVQASLRLYATSAHSGSSPSAAGAAVWCMVLAGAKLIISEEL